MESISIPWNNDREMIVEAQTRKMNENWKASPSGISKYTLTLNPDIVVRDHQKTKNCLLIDVSIPTDDKTSLKQMKKLSNPKI